MEMNFFEGRIGRGSYFLRLILVNLILIPSPYLILRYLPEAQALVAVTLVFSLALIYSISISGRRLHDLDKSGWVLLAPLISVFLLWFYPFTVFEFSDGQILFGGLVGPCFLIIVILIFSLYLLIAKGTEGPNSFDLDPLPATTNEEE